MILFFMIITLPLANDILHFIPEKPLPRVENSERNKRQPAGSFSRLAQKCEAQFERNFIFRKFLIGIYNSGKYLVFNKSGVAKVIIGRKGWLFQARRNKEPGTAGYYPSLRPFDLKELAAWRQALQNRRQWLHERGIEYLFILAPDKSSIYPEYLPENLRHFYGHSRLDQLSEYLKQNSSIEVLDIRSALKEAKKDSELYAKTDSHWNALGARIVSREILAYLSKHLKSRKSFKLSAGRVAEDRERAGGNLAVMLSLENTFFREERVKIIANRHFPARKARLPVILFSKNVVPEAFENKAAPFQNAVMFHDSFGRKLKPFLTGFFSRIVFIRDWGFRFNTRVIEKEKPAIVLDEIAEHFLYNVKLAESVTERNGI